MNRVPLYQVDAFTDRPFRGNPAAVCLLPLPLPDERLQAIAAEMNLSETAFLLRTNRRRWVSGDTFSLRWFTPRTEVALCGHATLASAAVLFQAVGVEAEVLSFQTLSGELRARRKGAGIELDFPVDPPEPCEPPDDVVTALGVPPEAVEDAVYGAQTRTLLIRLSQASLVRALAPDFTALLRASSMGDYQGLIVTAAGADDGPYDFISRFFAPWIGIDEDPVTGSSHTLLAPYWAAHLGKQHFRAYQASARGGELEVSLLGADRVALLGQAKIVLEGYLALA
ncbi:MAG: PhzF family phenazine biosynthesis protein [Anaerolineae bacterium]